ncbi:MULTISPECIES: hypothetical protein [unclassified Pseudodesulfovibrio]|uniref:hypothetical protein n=1 Tax=unclassified Pseudodesulfovibrio TaxID=2661612 RepID=UPI000FEB6553|nr:MULTISPECIES: hypothetical protein [unclassified Pseudodesulfovibrio]MCJ2165610.1 hypothetical protein [Pseudodesulfovibrio sp. S3-i]RWU03018.1 hypothetical protein DWB63_13295 [Pseudodesulfovibrio sp. S3]
MISDTNKKWQMTLPEDWTVRQMDENGVETEIPLRDHPSLEKYATKDEAVKALVHAQRMLGKSPDGYIRLPGDEDGPEALAAFHAALGRPEGPDGYELPGMDLPDGFEVREELIDGLRQKAHELGLNPKQVSGLYEWFMPMVLDAHHGLESEASKLCESELESLRSVHRGDTPALLDSALRAAEALGGEDLLVALDKTGAGNRAAVISAFAKIAPLVLEGGLRGSARGWGEDLTIERLREMMQDPRYKDPTKRDDTFVKKVNQGFELLYPGDYMPGSRI